MSKAARQDRSTPSYINAEKSSLKETRSLGFPRAFGLHSIADVGKDICRDNLATSTKNIYVPFFRINRVKPFVYSICADGLQDFRKS